MTNLILINSSKIFNLALNDFLIDIAEKGYLFHIFSGSGNISKTKSNFKIKKIYLGPEFKNNAILFYILFIPFSLYYFFVFVSLKRKSNVEAVVLCALNEKIYLTPVLKFLKIKTVWLELPEADYAKMSKRVVSLFCKRASSVKLAVFSSLSRLRLLNLNVKSEDIVFIPLSVKLNQPSEQTNIFSTLARTERTEIPRKYFTIGCVIDLSSPGQLENLFTAAKICLEVIPNMQIIVVNTGKDNEVQSKRFSWITKKMGIENITWFVKESNNLKKWMDSFDIFISLGERPELYNLSIILKAMSSGKAVICFDSQGNDDLIIDNKGGIISRSGDAENLADKIMLLYNNSRLRTILGNNARDLVITEYRTEKMMKEFERITHNA